VEALWCCCLSDVLYWTNVHLGLTYSCHAPVGCCCTFVLVDWFCVHFDYCLADLHLGRCGSRHTPHLPCNQHHPVCLAGGASGSDAEDDENEEEEEEDEEEGGNGAGSASAANRRGRGRQKQKVVKIPRLTTKSRPQPTEVFDEALAKRAVPRGPMLETMAGSNVWYQAYVIKESLNEVKMRVPSEKQGEGGIPLAGGGGGVQGKRAGGGRAGRPALALSGGMLAAQLAWQQAAHPGQCSPVAGIAGCLHHSCCCCRHACCRWVPMPPLPAVPDTTTTTTNPPFLPVTAEGRGRNTYHWLSKGSTRIWRGSMAGRDWNYKGKGAWEPKTGSSRGPTTARPHQARSRTSQGQPPATQGLSGGGRKSGGDGRMSAGNGVHSARPGGAPRGSGKAGRKSAGGSKRSREQAASSGAAWQQRGPWLDGQGPLGLPAPPGLALWTGS
jgi:hypothetical protein